MFCAIRPVEHSSESRIVLTIFKGMTGFTIKDTYITYHRFWSGLNGELQERPEAADDSNIEMF
jgi:hypothetical protein